MNIIRVVRKRAPFIFGFTAGLVLVVAFLWFGRSTPALANSTDGHQGDLAYLNKAGFSNRAGLSPAGRNQNPAGNAHARQNSRPTPHAYSATYHAADDVPPE
jgi:hypothetical protein